MKPFTKLASALFFFCFLKLSVKAQTDLPQAGKGKIVGRVVDSATGKALDYATITLADKITSKILNGTTSSADGKFTISEVSMGSYKMIVEFIGYQAFTNAEVVINKKSQTVNVNTIQLKKTGQLLQAVTVTAKAPLIDNKIDKMVFNAEKDITSQGGVATDILKKIPQVSVDVDGNVELAGSTSIRFLINGKPSTAFGSNIADVLQSIPSSQIKSIEVITNPGAKYDAEGLGGIINIILKQSTAKGINGNLSITAGSRTENGSFNFNARKGNLGINAFVSGNARLPVNTPGSSERLSTDTALKLSSKLTQDGSRKFKRQGIQTGFGIDWTYKKHNNFTGSVSYNDFGNGGNGQTNQDQVVVDANGNVLSHMASLNTFDNHYKFHTVDASINYKRTFEKEDRELEFAVNSSFGNSYGTSSNYQTLKPNDSLYYGIQNANPGKENETQISLDFTEPISEKVKLGVGSKLTLNDINSSADVNSYRPESKDFWYDSSLSNSLRYNQKVYGLYAEISFPVARWFDVKAGTRYEYTTIDSYYSNAQQQVKTPGYSNWVPSIYLLRKLKNNNTLKLSYSKRIERPDYDDLNPFINTSDPKNITAGNPYLLPELGQRIEFTYNHTLSSLGSVMITAFYRLNENDIQPYTKFYTQLPVGDSIYYNVSVSTRENIGTEKNTGVSLFADLHATSKLSFRTNLFLFHRHIINKIDPGSDRTSFNYRINVNATYQFTPTLVAEFFGNFNSPRNEVQGKYPSFTTYNLAIRKQFWNKKASLAFTTTNPFNEYVNQKMEIYGTNFSQTSLRQIPYRSFGINFTWKFGMLEFKKEKEEFGNDTTAAP